MRKAKNKLFFDNTNRDNIAHFVLEKTNTRRLIIINEIMNVATRAMASTINFRG